MKKTKEKVEYMQVSIEKYEKNCRLAEEKIKKLINGTEKEIVIEDIEVPELLACNYLVYLANYAEAVTGRALIETRYPNEPHKRFIRFYV